jgi:hypothetical protein
MNIAELVANNRKLIVELNQENTLIKSELCKKDNSYAWCSGAIK